MRNTDEQLLKQLFRLRVDAWRAQSGLKPGDPTGSDLWDDRSHHRVLLGPDQQVAGALRFSLHDDMNDLPDGGVWLTPFHDQPGPHAYFSRMFINPAFQGLGLSDYLDSLAVSEPLTMGAKTVTCLAGSVEASLKRVPQMIRRGWTQIGVANTPSPDAFWQADHRPVILAYSRIGA